MILLWGGGPGRKECEQRIRLILMKMGALGGCRACPGRTEGHWKALS